MMMFEIAAGIALFSGCLALSAAGIVMWTGLCCDVHIKDGDRDGAGKEIPECRAKESDPPEVG